MNKVDVLKNLCFQWYALNVNKINIIIYFSELICQFLLIVLELACVKF